MLLLLKNILQFCVGKFPVVPHHVYLVGEPLAIRVNLGLELRMSLSGHLLQRGLDVERLAQLDLPGDVPLPNIQDFISQIQLPSA